VSEVVSLSEVDGGGDGSWVSGCRFVGSACLFQEVGADSVEALVVDVAPTVVVGSEQPVGWRGSTVMGADWEQLDVLNGTELRSTSCYGNIKTCGVAVSAGQYFF
jgi:hypothetical protein